MTDKARHPAIDGLLAGLGAALGQALTLDDRGQCMLGFDGDVDVILAADAERLSWRSPLIEATSERANISLQLNYGRLPSSLSIALDKSSNVLTLFGSANADSLTADILIAKVAELVAYLPEIRGRLDGSDATKVQPPMPGGIRA
jgi:hypothetical protein